MATPVDLALDHYTDRQSFVDATALVAGQMWDQVDTAAIVDSWAAQLPELTAVVSGAQLGVARRADQYVTGMLDAEDLDAAAVAAVDPGGFAGQASDARGLLTLLANPAFVAVTSIKDGLDLARAMSAGRANLDLLVRTQVADAGRLADQAAITARPTATGYTRMAVGNSCARCLILSGKHYEWNTGFQRHPRCDCIHVPAGSRTALRIRSPQDIYAGMSTKERLRAGFSRADQKALAEGADLNQVVNARRGMQTAGGRLFTRVGAGKTPRLSVDQIYLEAGDNRAEAIRLLQRHRYLTAPARDRVDRAAKLVGPGGASPARVAAAHAVPIRAELAAARTVKDVEAAFIAQAKDITGRDIGAWFGPDASPKTAREHAEGVLLALERFPQAGLRRLTWFRDATDNTMARARGGIVEFNQAFAGTAERARYLRSLHNGVAEWDDGSLLGAYSFRGSGNPAAVAVHEFGHVLELDTIGASLAPKVDALVRELADREQLSRWQLVSRQVSRYATTDTTELIAEAFGDALLNGEAASELSRGILDLIEQEYAARGLGTAARLVSGRAAKSATEDLAKLNVAQLRALARERGLRGLSRARKADLIEALRAAPAPTLTGNAAVRAAARQRQREIAQAEGTARLLAEIDELIAKKADAAIIRERLNPALLGPEQLFANADPAALPVLLRALDSGDPAKLRAAVTRLSKKAGITPVGAAGTNVRFDPALHEALGALPQPGQAVRVIRRGSSITMPDGEVIQLTKAQVSIVTPAPGPGRTARSIRDIMAEFGPRLQAFGQDFTFDRARRQLLADLRNAVGDAVDGTYGGLTATVHEVSMLPSEDFLSVQGRIVDADGRQAGRFTRIFLQDQDTKELIVEHAFLQLARRVQGSGFAEQFNRNLYDWYRRSGISRVEVHANIDVGGYTWAVQGFDFRNERAAEIFVTAARRKLDAALARTPKGLTRDQVRELDRYLASIESGAVRASAPEIARFGRQPGQGGRNALWAGKWLMLRSHWNGALHL